MIACTVKIKTATGDSIRYDGLFKSTSDAVIDAFSKFIKARTVVVTGIHSKS